MQRVAFRAILVVSTAAAPLLRLLSETFAYETCARVVLRAHSVDKFLGNRTGAGKLSLPPTPFNILPNQDPTGVTPPILSYGTHSSFLHIILRVGFLAKILKSCRSGYDPLADVLEK